MFGLGIFEVLLLIFLVGGFIIWLHPELLTRSGYSGCLNPKKLGMAALRIVVWIIFLASTMPEPSYPLTASGTQMTLGWILGAGFLTWIFFRLLSRLLSIIRNTVAAFRKGFREGTTQDEGERKDQEAKRRAEQWAKQERARAGRRGQQQEDARRRAEEERRRSRAEDERQRSQAQSARDEKYYAAVLELAGTVTPAMVKEQYRKLAGQYHPDKVSHLGEKLQDLAHQEMEKINEAYNFFRKRLGF